MLIVIVLVLIVTGASYAALIYHSPPPYGWTWVSVVVGDAFTDLGMSGALFIGMIYLFGLDMALAGWWLVIIPEIAHICTGVPMVVGQIMKKKNDDKSADKFKGKYGKSAS